MCGKVLGSLCTLVMQVYLGDADEVSIYSCSCFPAADNGEGSGKEKAAMSDSSAKPNTAAPTVKIKEWFEAKSPEGYSYYWNVTTNGVYVCLSSIYVHHVCVLFGVCVFVHVYVTVCVFAQVHLAHVHHVCIGVCIFLCLCVCPSLSSTCTPHLCNMR